MSELEVAKEGELQIPEFFAKHVEAGKRRKEKSRAANTFRGYESDWKHFEDWCAHASHESGVKIKSLPAEPGTVWLYLNALLDDDNAADYRAATLERRLSAIRWFQPRSAQLPRRRPRS